MNQQTTTNRFGIWAVTILIIMNVALIGLLWYEHFGRQPIRPALENVDPDGPFARELQLDQRQADSVKILRDKHFQQRNAIVHQITALNRQMTDELFAPKPDTLHVQALVNQIGQHHAQMERLVYDHFNDIKELCRPDQHQLLERLLRDAILSKRPPRPHGGPGPAGDCPPPGRQPPPRGEPPQGP